jgi:hypothetical protein
MAARHADAGEQTPMINRFVGLAHGSAPAARGNRGAVGGAR